jgi:hypothetical protein
MKSNPLIISLLFGAETASFYLVNTFSHQHFHAIFRNEKASIEFRLFQFILNKPVFNIGN